MFLGLTAGSVPLGSERCPCAWMNLQGSALGGAESQVETMTWNVTRILPLPVKEGWGEGFELQASQDISHIRFEYTHVVRGPFFRTANVNGVWCVNPDLKVMRTTNTMPR